MDKNSSLFFISGLSSLSMFALIIALFFYMLISKDIHKNFAMKKDKFLSVSMESTPTKRVTQKTTKPQITQTTTEIEAVEKVEIGNLFEKVWTKDVKRLAKVKKESKKVDHRLIDQLSKKIKTTTKNAQKSVVEKKSSVVAKKIDEKDAVVSTGDEVNEYNAKIYALVYKKFDPPENSQGHTVKAVIEISALGKVLDFRILNYSSNDALNEECDKLKMRLISLMFPVSPNNSSSRIIVNLESEK